ncbi:urease accessory protein [Faunimonas pinastri]|uniref:Urease accessory protein UreD n=1 Tax=Faunimonas pinastri TaxID=1855383 RepID=A0A1H9KSN0_9HYPH|nr:urease accessory protein UreD [Faunimonas pinastri]SER02049.1 urease accessory protein [Faunimonas pinastri]
MRTALEIVDNVPEGVGMQRTSGESRIRFHVRDGAARLDRLYQQGAAKIRLPRPEPGRPPEAVLINTAGGLTGGDTMAFEVEVADGAHAVVTTQACEKIYKSSSGPAQVASRLSVGAHARLDWLPQETILFNRARLSRRLEADLADGATLLALEAVVFGRIAMGEVVASGSFHERWRIRRNGRLVFADDTRIDGSVADIASHPAVLAGGRAVATVVYVAENAEDYLERAREAVGESGGVTAFDGKLVARIISMDTLSLRRALVPLLAVLADGAPLPKVWHI